MEKSQVRNGGREEGPENRSGEEKEPEKGRRGREGRKNIKKEERRRGEEGRGRRKAQQCSESSSPELSSALEVVQV